MFNIDPRQKKNEHTACFSAQATSIYALICLHVLSLQICIEIERKMPNRGFCQYLKRNFASTSVFQTSCFDKYDHMCLLQEQKVFGLGCLQSKWGSLARMDVNKYLFFVWVLKVKELQTSGSRKHRLPTGTMISKRDGRELLK